MSLDPLLWALNDSPTADTFERLILVALAERADPDGCNAFPSKATLARAALCDEKTVGRKLARLRERGLIAEGDQSAARHIPKHNRPVVYDLLIPCSWYGHRMERVNEERQQKGLSPLTARSRPDIAPAPARTRRSDYGKKRVTVDNEAPYRGDSESQDSQSPLGGGVEGGTESPGRGDSQSAQGGLEDPQTSPMNLPSNPPQGDGAADVRIRPADESVAATGGNGKPSRPRKKTPEATARQEARTREEEVLNRLAQDGATAWWEHAHKQFGTWAGGENGFLMLRGMIKRAAKAKYTKQQIWAALLDCGKHVPSAQQWQAALGAAAGKAVQPGRRGAVPMYDDAASHPQQQDPSPRPTTDELMNALSSR
ncbi:helix-turn-helix domain-containing protein [Kitasatospora sp. NPDC090091]|uniref:helix-turn-helix domain-containing protein n=1 Tax=Kitasatospora sp. NPDC090091 TaxID=3364081 RepID=UPI0037FD4BC4